MPMKSRRRAQQERLASRPPPTDRALQTRVLRQMGFTREQASHYGGNTMEAMYRWAEKHTPRDEQRFVWARKNAYGATDEEFFNTPFGQFYTHGLRWVYIVTYSVMLPDDYLTSDTITIPSEFPLTIAELDAAVRGRLEADNAHSKIRSPDYPTTDGTYLGIYSVEILRLSSESFR